jgi:diguanylate cyclase (GGDEF)-like protein
MSAWTTIRTATAREALLAEAINCLASHVAVLDPDGQIIDVNDRWRQFAMDNDGREQANPVGINYLAVCDRAVGRSAVQAALVAQGIRDVLAGRRDRFEAEYPCHAPSRQRWFKVSITPMEQAGQRYAVVSHDDITERVLAERELQKANRRLESLATTDGLTGLLNRRAVDQILADLHRRHSRSARPMTLLLIDVDHFKAYNDKLGHQAGDQCLRDLAKTFKSMCRRPDDYAGRFGGEEFAIILGETDARGGHHRARQVCETIRALRLPHPQSTVGDVVTVSIGVATLTQPSTSSVAELIEAADTALYEAKTAGRDRACLGRLNPQQQSASHQAASQEALPSLTSSAARGSGQTPGPSAA